MKPRLIKIDGLWCCKRWGDKTGIGYTPRQAYQDWAWCNGVTA